MGDVRGTDSPDPVRVIASPVTLGWLLDFGTVALERAAFLETAPLVAQRPVDRDRVAGMLLGLALGDSLGNTSEALVPGVRAALYGEIRDYLPNRHG